VSHWKLPSAAEAPRGEADAENAWEAAYLRFETPEEESRKFRRRLERLQATSWPRQGRIVELFCGRGSGLRALERLGFSRLSGIDQSIALIREYRGRAPLVVADCRALPYRDESQDVAIIQGGLHHLPGLHEDLERTLSEARRVLKKGGRLVVVEPWQTPFLSLVHALARTELARRISRKLDALASMVELEGETYLSWLRSSSLILHTLERFFRTEVRRRQWGKLLFVGRSPGNESRSAA
jgi:ubiquinone/menaquinone biosynthesis C-methylase UbiE